MIKFLRLVSILILYGLSCNILTSQTVALHAEETRISENGGVTNIVLTLSEIVEGNNVNVGLSFSGNSTDYSGATSNVIIPAGSIESKIKISAIDDYEIEGDETVVVNITSVSNASSSKENQVTLIILDDDTEPIVSLELYIDKVVENEDKVVQWDPLGSSAQQWQVSESGDGYFFISNSLTGNVLDVPNWSTELGKEIIQYPNSGGINQQWYFTKVYTNPKVFKVSSSVIGSGSISLESGSYEEGSTIEIMAYPDKNWELVRWSGVDNSSGNTASVIVKNDLQVVATFSEVVTHIIQEKEAGFCDVEGRIENEHDGYTGEGYSNTSNLYGSGINYMVDASGGAARLIVRYASLTDRPAKVYINGELQDESLKLTTTGGWGNWDTTSVEINFENGANQLRIEGSSLFGMPNVDYIALRDQDVRGVDCSINTYSLSVSYDTGQGIIEPSEGTFVEGDTVVLTAYPNENYLFSSWSNVFESNGSSAIVVMNGDIEVSATFSKIVDANLLSGTYRISSRFNDLTLSLKEERSENDIPIVQNEYLNSVYQHWRFVKIDGSNYSIINDKTNMSMGIGAPHIVAKLDHPTSDDVILEISSAGATTSISDYVGGFSQITIPAGQLSAAKAVFPVDDALIEGTETVVYGIKKAQNAQIGKNDNCIVSILDDESLPELWFESNNDTISEYSEDVNISVIMSHASSEDVVVKFSYSGTADENDYTLSHDSLIIKAGEKSGSILLKSNDDNIYEGTEILTVDINNVTNGVEFSVQQMNITILDNDSVPLVSISSAPASIVELDGTAEIYVQLDHPSTETVTVNLEFTGAAIENTDYKVSDTIAIIQPGSKQAIIEIKTIDDEIHEGRELITGSVLSAENAIIGDEKNIEIYIDDDETQPSVNIMIVQDSINEKDGMATVEARLSYQTIQDVTVWLTYTGTSNSGVDFTQPADSMVVFAGDSLAMISVFGIDDSVYEGDESLVVDVSYVSNATENGEQKDTLIIVDDETIPEVSISVSSDTIIENDSSVSITATLNRVSTNNVLVTLAFSGSATGAGGDYTLTSNTVLIPAGSLSASTRINIVNDSIYEGDESVLIDIASVTNALENGLQQAQMVIKDDETVPEVWLFMDQDSIQEKDGACEIYGIISHLTTNDISIEITFLGDAQGGGVDYIASTSTIIIPAGSISGKITILAIDDILVEGNEWLSAQITEAFNAVVKDIDLDSITIIDDDSEPLVSMQISTDSISENGGVVEITAILDRISANLVNVAIGFNGSATGSGIDYLPLYSEIIIEPGDSLGTISLVAIDDYLIEGTEYVSITIESVENGLEDNIQVDTLYIVDNDYRPSVQLLSSTNNVQEDNGTFNLSAELSHIISEDVILYFSLTGSATANIDYTVPALFCIVDSGNLYAEIEFSIVNDLFVEGAETIKYAIDSVKNASIGNISTGVVEIIDNDADPEVEIEIIPETILEDNGVAEITVNLNHITASSVLVVLSISGSATSQDYSYESDTVTILPGNTTGKIGLTAIDDELVEGNESVIVTIDTVINGIKSINISDSVFIIDDESDPEITMTIDNKIINEQSGISNINITLDHLTNFDVEVALSISGSAENGTDYNLSSQTILIPAGELFGGVSLSALEDEDVESDESVVFEVVNVTHAVEANPQIDSVLIIDNDHKPQINFTINSDTAIEKGGLFVVNAQLSQSFNQQVVVSFSFSGNAMGNYVDYFTASKNIIIEPGSLSGSLAIVCVDDVAVEGDESIFVKVDTVINANVITFYQWELIIQDNDDLPIMSLDVSPLEIYEDGGIATITTHLSQPVDKNVQVDLALSGSAEGNGVDYMVINKSIIIPKGSVSAKTSIIAINDQLIEGDESIVVKIDTVINAKELVQQEASINIVDNDSEPELEIIVNANLINENGGVSTITASLDHPVEDDVEVQFSFYGTAQNNGIDYLASSGLLIIPARNTKSSITLNAVNDDIIEGNEQIIFSIDTVFNASFNSSFADTVTIVDDDQLPQATISFDRDLLQERGGIALINASLNHSTSKNVKVFLSFRGSATGKGVDYLSSSTYIPVMAGNTSGNISITAINDIVIEGDEEVIIGVDSLVNAIEFGIQKDTLLIVDDDEIPKVRLASSIPYIPENSGSAPLIFSMDHIADNDVEVYLSFSGSAKPNGVDFVTSSSVVKIFSGNISGMTTITSINDNIFEGQEEVVITIDSVTNAIYAGVDTDTLAIIDDDAMPVVSCRLDKHYLQESDEKAILNIVLSNPASKEVSMNVVFSGSAQQSIDFTFVSGLVVFKPGMENQSFNITTVDDELDEENETVILKLANIQNALQLSSWSDTIVIIDNDEVYINHQPVAVIDSNRVKFDSVAVGWLLNNDYDLDGDVLNIETDPITQPKHGNVVIHKSGVYSYEPTYGYIGDDFFEYRICDNGSPSLCDSALVFITVLSNDQDNDGILDAEEGSGDVDNDGLPNYLDEDSDNDGYPDAFEGVDDFDLDGIPNFIDTDSDNDLLADSVERKGDCDSDGFINIYDADFCYDGIYKIPEGFSPNNDGNNDYFVIPGIDFYNQVSLKIYNRWGKMVYQDDNYANNWNGTANVQNSQDSNLPLGTYYFIIHVFDTNEDIAGFVYLTR